MSRIDTEDNAVDAVQKALRGLTLDGESIDPGIHQRIEDLKHQLESGNLVEQDWFVVARTLGLHGPSLLEFARRPSVEATPLPNGWQQWVLPFGPYTVNAYALPLSDQKCILIDAGDHVNDFYSRLEKSNRIPTHLLITHNHHDHVGAVGKLISDYPDLKIYAMQPSLYKDTLPLSDLSEFDIAPYHFQAYHTPGHASDSISYLIHSEQSPPAMAVGDCIYAKSAGGVRSHYREALHMIRSKILDHPDHTLLLPGHGPVTTVGLEKSHNPFFA